MDVVQDDSKGAEVRELMAKAFKGPLIPQQQQQVMVIMTMRR